jgi:hypothetical protein
LRLPYCASTMYGVTKPMTKFQNQLDANHDLAFTTAM